ncbi:hypothetical protein AB0I98_46770 [Streptomyces sp. NPDC050211]|uniref:preprotein translocase subunit SecA n=1 Tax=Streptomyces sp. NPDC050211 TaxID=3154932 RepID=UPI00342AC36F
MITGHELGEGLTDGQKIAVMAMARDHAVVERLAVGIDTLLVDIIAAGVSAIVDCERVYVAYPDEEQADVSARHAEVLLGRYEMEVGHLREAMYPQAMARIFATSTVVIGSKLAFDIAKLNTRNGGLHGYRQPDGWVFPEVDLTLIDRANQRTLLIEETGEERRRGRTIDALTAMELIGDSWWTGSTGALGDEPSRIQFAELGKNVVRIRPNHPRIVEDYDADFDTVDQACDFAEELVEEARGFPVLIGAAATPNAVTFSARLHGAGIGHELLTADNIDRASRVFAGAGRRGAVTVTSVQLRGQDIELDSGLNVEGGGLQTIILGPLPSLRDEHHARAVSGRRGDHGKTWVLRFPQKAPASGHPEPDIIITRC